MYFFKQTLRYPLFMLEIMYFSFEYGALLYQKTGRRDDMFIKLLGTLLIF